MTIEDMMRLHAGDVRRRVLRLVGPEAVDDVC